MKVLMAGGGSGGHVTPLRAVISELKKITKQPLEVTVVTDRGFYSQTKFLFKDQKDIVLKKIFSGKYRRYNSKSFLWHITHLPTVLKNLRDIAYIIFGLLQSVIYFLSHKPDVVFAKGGFVCVPIGITARLFKVPLIIHDSDTHPGLTNRILSKWADKIATGMPTRYYEYPVKKTVYTGIPVSSEFKVIKKSEANNYKAELGFDRSKPLVLVTGGGTGAKVLNDAVINNASNLIDKGWQIALITGKNKSKSAQKLFGSLLKTQKHSFKYYEFTEVAPLALAADVIVSRAGATAMQEFANAKKTVVIVPSPYLTGGHQLKNAQMFLENNAGMVLSEAELNSPGALIQMIEAVYWSDALAESLFKNFAKPHAASDIAKLLITVA